MKLSKTFTSQYLKLNRASGKDDAAPAKIDAHTELVLDFFEDEINAPKMKKAQPEKNKDPIFALHNYQSF